jgi:hypothetical protein
MPVHLARGLGNWKPLDDPFQTAISYVRWTISYVDIGGARVFKAHSESQISVLSSEKNWEKLELLKQSMARCQKQAPADLQPSRHDVECVLYCQCIRDSIQYSRFYIVHNITENCYVVYEYMILYPDVQYQTLTYDVVCWRTISYTMWCMSLHTTSNNIVYKIVHSIHTMSYIL